MTWLCNISNLFCFYYLQFDADDTGSVVLYGGGALVALWLTSAVIGAIDSIPLVCIKLKMSVFQTRIQLLNANIFFIHSCGSSPSCWKL